jgi:hypothetical protein
MSRRTIKPLIVGVILVAVCLALRVILPQVLPPEAGQAAAFFSVLVAIVGGYICFVAFMSRLLSGRVPERVHLILERVLIAGILLGIAGMFQARIPVLYPLGFLLLFFATWVFTLWGYVVPKGEQTSE